MTPGLRQYAIPIWRGATTVYVLQHWALEHLPQPECTTLDAPLTEDGVDSRRWQKPTCTGRRLEDTSEEAAEPLPSQPPVAGAGTVTHDLLALGAHTNRSAVGVAQFVRASCCRPGCQGWAVLAVV